MNQLEYIKYNFLPLIVVSIINGAVYSSVASWIIAIRHLRMRAKQRSIELQN
ncbi:MAG: hypothetical protein ACFE9Z_16185 [Promethearchaeota archaeon]